MRRGSLPVLLSGAMAAAVPALAHAQACPARPASWSATAGVSDSVGIAGSRPGVRALHQQVSVMRDAACLRGRIALGASGGPMLLSGGGTRATALALRPLAVRWHARVPYVEVAGGVLVSDRPVPGETTRVNFTAHVEAGVRLAVSERYGIVVGYRIEHASNGGRIRRNPGLNSHGPVVGLTWGPS